MIDSIIWGSIKGRTLFGSCKKPCTNSTLFNSILNWPIRAGANQNILQKLWRRVERSEFKGSSSGSGLPSTIRVHAEILDCALVRDMTLHLVKVLILKRDMSRQTGCFQYTKSWQNLDMLFWYAAWIYLYLVSLFLKRHDYTLLKRFVPCRTFNSLKD